MISAQRHRKKKPAKIVRIISLWRTLYRIKITNCGTFHSIPPIQTLKHPEWCNRIVATLWFHWRWNYMIISTRTFWNSKTVHRFDAQSSIKRIYCVEMKYASIHKRRRRSNSVHWCTWPCNVSGISNLVWINTTIQWLKMNSKSITISIHSNVAHWIIEKHSFATNIAATPNRIFRHEFHAMELAMES